MALNDGTNPPAPDEESKPDRLHLFDRETLEQKLRSAAQREHDLIAELNTTKDFVANRQEVVNNQAREVEDLRAKLRAHEAGADHNPPGAERSTRTPGQLWRILLDSTEDQRLALLANILETAHTAEECYAQDHAGLMRQADIDREQLSIAVFDMPTLDSTQGLLTAVRALRQIMVDGIGQRTERVQYAVAQPEDDEDLDGFPQEKGVADKIKEQLDAAGIDLTAKCGWEWETLLDEPDSSICTSHLCGLVNPLHSTSHECAKCGAFQTQAEAELMAMEAGR